VSTVEKKVVVSVDLPDGVTAELQFEGESTTERRVSRDPYDKFFDGVMDSMGFRAKVSEKTKLTSNKPIKLVLYIPPGKGGAVAEVLQKLMMEVMDV
jgi:hypothetical protein